jgi:hypothetical protein
MVTEFLSSNVFILRYLSRVSSKSGAYMVSEMNVVAQKADGLNREDYY